MDMTKDSRLIGFLLVLPPIETKNLTAADVDSLTQSTRESMLKTLTEMAHANKEKVPAARGPAVSTAVEI